MNVKEFGLLGRNHYAHADNPPYWEKAPGSVDALFLRRAVAARLADVDKSLRPAGLRLFIYDAWRPRAVQAYFFHEWTPREIRRRRPELDGEALREEVLRYWAEPSDDPNAPAPHATGAAVDLTIVQDSGATLWMGGLFDDPSPLSHLEHFEHLQTNGLALSDEEARANRRLLYWSMRAQGFVGLETEWWHYSWGDQMWAHRTGAPAAFYGLAEPPAALP